MLNPVTCPKCLSFQTNGILSCKCDDISIPESKTQPHSVLKEILEAHELVLVKIKELEDKITKLSI